MENVKFVIVSSFGVSGTMKDREAGKLIDRVNKEFQDRKTNFSVGLIGSGDTFPEDAANCDIVFALLYKKPDGKGRLSMEDELEKLGQKGVCVVTDVCVVSDEAEMISDISGRFGNNDPEKQAVTFAHIHHIVGDNFCDNFDTIASRRRHVHYEAALEFYRRLAEMSPEKYEDVFFSYCEHINAIFAENFPLSKCRPNAGASKSIYEDTFYLSARTVDLYGAILRKRIYSEKDNAGECDSLYAEKVASFCESFAKMLIRTVNFKEAEEIIRIAIEFRGFLNKNGDKLSWLWQALRLQLYTYCGMGDIQAAEDCFSRIYSDEFKIIKGRHCDEVDDRWALLKMYGEPNVSITDKRVAANIDRLMQIMPKYSKDVHAGTLGLIRDFGLVAKQPFEINLVSSAADLKGQSYDLQRVRSEINIETSNLVCRFNFVEAAIFDANKKPEKSFHSYKEKKLTVVFFRDSISDSAMNALSAAIKNAESNRLNIKVMILTYAHGELSDDDRIKLSDIAEKSGCILKQYYDTYDAMEIIDNIIEQEDIGFDH